MEGIAYIMGAHAVARHIPMSALLTRKLEQARASLERGNLATVHTLCSEVLRRAPRNPDALWLLGACALMGGQAREAVPLLEQALATAPGHGAALEHLGLAYLLLGQFSAAESALARAAALQGAPASVHMRLGLAILNQGRAAEAVTALERAHRLAPGDPVCLVNLGQALGQQGERAAATASFRKALALAPDLADARYNLGVLHLEAGEWDGARVEFERVVQQAPDFTDALVNLGVVHQKQEQSDQALACFERVLAVSPTHAHALTGRAQVLAARGRHEDAIVQYRAALAAAPTLIGAREGLAASCIALGRTREALEQLQTLVTAEPANAAALGVLAETLFQGGQIDAARDAALRAREINADAVVPWSVLAQVHFVRGELDQAVEVLDAGWQRTRSPGLLGMLNHQLRRLCDWQRWRETWPRLASLLPEHADLGTPFALLCEDTTAAQQLDYTRRWAAARFGATAAAGPAAHGTARAPGRLRIGYLSSDFQEHPAAYLLAEMLEHHDRERFELFAYSYGPPDQGAMRQRLLKTFDHFIDIAWDPDDVAAQRMRDDQLDVLVELKGYTLGDRLGIMALRPCARQITWLGYPGTTGAAFVDYLIADPYIIRPGEEAAYAERVLRLPHCYQPNDSRRPVAAPLPRAEYGLPEQAFVFCCFNQVYKITPEIFTCWMRLLGAVEHSVLWLVDENVWATRNLRAAAAAQGIAPERLVFAGRRPLDQHLARYHAADLALDTFPYTSHTTASDALWCGCPLVGLCGDTFAARVSGSLLTACGLPELVTHDLSAYEALALHLARDKAALGRVRAKICDARQSAPLFDAQGFARDLEHLYCGLMKT